MLTLTENASTVVKTIVDQSVEAPGGRSADQPGRRGLPRPARHRHRGTRSPATRSSRRTAPASSSRRPPPRPSTTRSSTRRSTTTEACSSRSPCSRPVPHAYDGPRITPGAVVTGGRRRRPSSGSSPAAADPDWVCGAPRAAWPCRSAGRGWPGNCPPVRPGGPPNPPRPPGPPAVPPLLAAARAAPPAPLSATAVIATAATVRRDQTAAASDRRVRTGRRSARCPGGRLDGASGRTRCMRGGMRRRVVVHGRSLLRRPVRRPVRTLARRCDSARREPGLIAPSRKTSPPRLVESCAGATGSTALGGPTGLTGCAQTSPRVPAPGRETFWRHAARELRPALTRPDGSPLRVLVVDDEVNIAELISMAVRYEGWEPSVAHTGSKAVAAAKDIRPGRGRARRDAARLRRHGGAAPDAQPRTPTYPCCSSPPATPSRTASPG